MSSHGGGGLGHHSVGVQRVAANRTEAADNLGTQIRRGRGKTGFRGLQGQRALADMRRTYFQAADQLGNRARIQSGRDWRDGGNRGRHPLPMGDPPGCFPHRSQRYDQVRLVQQMGRRGDACEQAAPAGPRRNLADGQIQPLDKPLQQVQVGQGRRCGKLRKRRAFPFRAPLDAGSIARFQPLTGQGQRCRTFPAASGASPVRRCATRPFPVALPQLQSPESTPASAQSAPELGVAGAASAREPAVQRSHSAVRRRLRLEPGLATAPSAGVPAAAVARRARRPASRRNAAGGAWPARPRACLATARSEQSPAAATTRTRRALGGIPADRVRWARSAVSPASAASTNSASSSTARIRPFPRP